MRSLLALLPTLVLAAATEAAVIDVNPGPGALQAAINAASPGDVLRVHAGTYNEAVSIDRPLKVIGDDATQVTIDAGCGALTALSVDADRVTIQGVHVTRGTFFAIDIENRDEAVSIPHSLRLDCRTQQTAEKYERQQISTQTIERRSFNPLDCAGRLLGRNVNQL